MRAGINKGYGYSSKTLKTSFGDAEIAIPRDRKGEFDPQILKKNQTSISEDIEAKIISMYPYASWGNVAWYRTACNVKRTAWINMINPWILHATNSLHDAQSYVLVYIVF